MTAPKNLIVICFAITNFIQRDATAGPINLDFHCIQFQRGRFGLVVASFNG